MTINHKDCDHPATKAARAECRKNAFFLNSHRAADLLADELGLQEGTYPTCSFCGHRAWDEKNLTLHFHRNHLWKAVDANGATLAEGIYDEMTAYGNAHPEVADIRPASKKGR